MTNFDPRPAGLSAASPFFGHAAPAYQPGTLMKWLADRIGLPPFADPFASNTERKQ
jgi:hypothetical protein